MERPIDISPTRAESNHPETCQNCGEYELRLLFPVDDYVTGDSFLLYECLRCRLVATHPQPTGRDLAAYYPAAYYEWAEDSGLGLGRALLRFWDWARNSRNRQVLAKLDSPGRLLDVDCGRGADMQFFQRHGWDIQGTELDDWQIPDQLRGRVHFGDIRDEDWDPGKFECICFWNTLEHLPDPRAQLAAARRRLAPGGSLFIEVPNLSSWQARVFGRHWFHLDPPRHLHHFRPESLADMLSELGFSCERLPGIAHEYESFGWIQSTQNAILGKPNQLYVNLKAGRKTPAQLALILLGAVLGIASLPLIAAARMFGAGAMLRFRAWIE